jgi:hypothetical protein
MKDKEFFIEVDTMTPYLEIPEGVHGKFLLISRPEHLHQFKKPQLVTLRAMLRGNTIKSDERKSRNILARECFTIAFQEKTNNRWANSKLEKLLEYLKEHKTVSRQKLAEVAGYDFDYVNKAVLKLKWGSLRRKPVNIDYNRKKQEYTYAEKPTTENREVQD